MAKNPADLIESYTPQDPTPKDIIHFIEKDLSNLEKKYAPEVRARLDLLFYINLTHHHLKIDKMPDSHGLSKFGWRSISALIGWASLIYYADGRSPGFLRKKNGTLTTRKFI